MNAINDKINILSPKNNFIQITARETNVFNKNNQSISVNTGDLVIFPSELYHRVNTVKDEKCRTSLAFNVFIKGSVGMTSKLTKLIL